MPSGQSGATVCNSYYIAVKSLLPAGFYLNKTKEIILKPQRIKTYIKS